MSRYLTGELEQAISARRAVVVCGAGVGMAATGRPEETSWQGLLLSGAQRVLDISDDHDETWLDDIRGRVASSDASALIEAAQEIQGTLETLPGNHFRKFLAGTVGSWQSSSPGLLRAIADLEIPVVTTNYDDLLLSVVGGNVATWRDISAMQRLIRGEERGVVHLHGHWRDEQSVVLGMASYADAMGHVPSQQLVRALFATNTMIFVGFGSGLDDPNFLGIREWAREVLRETDYPPTLLVRNDQVAQARHNYGPDGFQVIGFGDEHQDLEIFLADLVPTETSGLGILDFDWNALQVMLNRMSMRIRREFQPQLVIAMSGPGNFAPSYCLSLDPDETPLITAVTFPRTHGQSERNEWFSEVAAQANWIHFQSTKWDVFLPNFLASLTEPTRILIFDDRVIGGTIQRMVQNWLRNLGHEVRRAAVIVHPNAKAEVDWYEREYGEQFYFPWGGRRGRAGTSG